MRIAACLWFIGAAGVSQLTTHGPVEPTVARECGCNSNEWRVSIRLLRDALRLVDGAKYVGDFSDVDITALSTVSHALIVSELEYSGVSLQNFFQYIRGGTVPVQCPAGLASAAVISFVAISWDVPSVDVVVATQFQLLASQAIIALAPLLGDTCMESPWWLFDLLDTQHNIVRFATRSDAEMKMPFVWRPYAKSKPMPCVRDGSVDACCGGQAWVSLEENFAVVFAHPSWAMVPLPYYTSLFPIVDAWDYGTWWKLFPWLADCKTGHSALLIARGFSEKRRLDDETVATVLRLLAQHPLDQLVASRFPIFGLLAKVLEDASESEAAPAECQGDLVRYFYAVLSGAAPRDERFEKAAKLAVDMGPGAVPSLGALACASQRAVAGIALTKRLPLGMTLAFDEELAPAWLRPTPWPVWSALHAFWPPAAPPAGLDASIAWNLGSLRHASATSLEDAGFEAVERHLASSDFKDWGILSDHAGLVLETLQDSSLVAAMDLEMARRAEGRNVESQKLRVAALEARLDIFTDNMNFMDGLGGWLDVTAPTLGWGPAVYSQYFKRKWARFLETAAEGRTGNQGSPKHVGSFDSMLFGLLLAWSADFIAWPSRPTKEDIESLGVYDVVVVLDPYPPGKPPILPEVFGQVRLWMPWEPYSMLGNVTLPRDYCPVVVDQFAVATTSSVLFWHHYLVAGLRYAFPPPADGKPDARRVFVFYASKAFSLLRALRASGFTPTHCEATCSRATYFGELQRSSLAVLPSGLGDFARPSAGQVIADAAIARCVPTFAPRSKLFARLLNPDFLSYRSIEEAVTKMLLLVSQPEKLQALADRVCHRLRYVNASEAETAHQLLDRIGRKAPGDKRCGPPPRPQTDRNSLRRDRAKPHLWNAGLGENENDPYLTK